MTTPTPTDTPSEPVTSERERNRDSLFLLGRLRVGDDQVLHDARIRNLSEGGLMAEFPHPVPVGEAVWLELRGVGEVTGQVAWCEAQRIGVAFDRPIDPKLARKPVTRRPS